MKQNGTNISITEHNGTNRNVEEQMEQTNLLFHLFQTEKLQKIAYFCLKMLSAGKLKISSCKSISSVGFGTLVPFVSFCPCVHVYVSVFV